MTVFEIILFILVSLGLLALAVYLRMKEQRYLKKKTKDALSKDLREEIELERSENIRKSEEFKKKLKQFGGEP